MKRTDASRSLALAAGAVIVALTAGAFALSYAHLHDVAAAHGLNTPWRAWAWPGCLDAFIVAGEILMLRAALLSRTDWWAIALTASGSLGSIALNVAGVGQGATVLDHVVAAVPPAAALLAFGALMRQVHQAIADSGEATTELVTVERIEAPEPVTSVADFDPLPVLGMTNEATTHGPGFVALDDLELKAIQWPPPGSEVTSGTRAKVTTAAASKTARQAVTAVVVTTPADLRKQARKLNSKLVTETGREVTIDRLRTEFGLTRRDAVTLRREILEGARS